MPDSIDAVLAPLYDDSVGRFLQIWKGSNLHIIQSAQTRMPS